MSNQPYASSRNFLTCIFCLIPAYNYAGPKEFKAIYLPILPGMVAGEAIDVNDSFEVVGYGLEDSNSNSPVIWTAISGPQRLAIASGFQQGVALSINNKSEIVGYLWAPGVGRVPAFWPSPSSQPVVLFESMGMKGTATCINNNSQIAIQTAQSLLFNTGIAFYDPKSGLSILPVTQSRPLASDLSDHGEIVGSHVTLGERPIYWSLQTGLIDLGIGGITNGVAEGINEFGEIVGNVSTDSYSQRGYKWLTITAGSPIGQLLEGGFNYDLFPKDINNFSEICGYTRIQENSIVWDPRTGARALKNVSSNLNGDLTDRTYNINDLGCIVGTLRTAKLPVMYVPENIDLGIANAYSIKRR